MDCPHYRSRWRGWTVGGIEAWIQLGEAVGLTREQVTQLGNGEPRCTFCG